MKFQSLNFKKIFGSTFIFWMKYYKYFFGLLFLLAMIFGAFIWYDTFYLFSWTDEKKQQYTLTQSRNINLKENEFNEILKEIEKRESNFNLPHEKIKDIFMTE